MDSILKHNKAITATIVTAAILSGIARIFSYKMGHYMLLTVVIAYLVYRLLYFTIIFVKHKRLGKTDKQHLAIFVVLLVVVIFNNFNFLEAPFISLFLLLLDYLISLQTAAKDAAKNDG